MNCASTVTIVAPRVSAYSFVLHAVSTRSCCVYQTQEAAKIIYSRICKKYTDDDASSTRDHIISCVCCLPFCPCLYFTCLKTKREALLMLADDKKDAEMRMNGEYRSHCSASSVLFSSSNHSSMAGSCQFDLVRASL